MIFQPELCRKIASGKKTMTRRPVRAGQERCRYRAGHTYAVQPGRGQPEVFRIEILGVDRQRLEQVDNRDAKREGFESRDEFVEYWCELYGAFDPEQLVWVIVFRPLEDPARLLHRDSSRGYTSKPELALPDEPEAVPAQWAADRTTAIRSAEERDRRRSLTERQEQPLERRLAAVCSDAEARAIDVSSSVRVIERQVESLERRVYLRNAAA